MKKIQTAFVRDPEDRRFVTREVSPGCEWVLNGEGRATRKYDGTCVMFDGDEWFCRREVKPGKPAPAGFIPVQVDDVTGKTVGWEPAEQSPFHKSLDEAVAAARQDEDAMRERAIADDVLDMVDWRVVHPGTFELCGPKINGNPEGLDAHRLLRHGDPFLSDYLIGAGRTYDTIRESVLSEDGSCEGIVFHHPDGRMAKIKAKDFPA